MAGRLTERRYSRDHLWREPDGTVGVTAALTSALRSLVSVMVPAIGEEVRAAEPFGGFESDKGIVDLYSPCDGRIVARDEVLQDSTALVAAPEETWLVRIEGRPVGLLSWAEYGALTDRAWARHGVGDDGDDAATPAAGALEHVVCKHALQEVRPRQAARA